MRIAYLGSKGLPSKSGTERVVEAVVRRLGGRHDVTVYCDAAYTPIDEQVDGVRLVRIFALKGKHIHAVSLCLFSTLHALFSHYDLIHLQGVDSSFVLPLLRLKYKVITTSHGAPGRMSRLKWGRLAWRIILWMERPFVYLSNVATSVSSLDADYLNARYRRDVVYIPNGVDDSVQADIDKAREKLMEVGLEPGKYLMFAAGRIDPTKGCHLVIEALTRMEYPLKLAVVGDLNQLPSYGEHLREMAEKEQVVFIPPISDQSLLFGMVKLARLFIFPSTSEGMSMMLLEAASLEAPILCSDIPENQIVMQDKVAYFRSEDAWHLAEQIRWALDHPDEMSRLARRACAYVKNTLTWERIACQYEDLYETCRHGHRGDTRTTWNKIVATK